MFGLGSEDVGGENAVMKWTVCFGAAWLEMADVNRQQGKYWNRLGCT